MIIHDFKKLIIFNIITYNIFVREKTVTRKFEIENVSYSTLTVASVAVAIQRERCSQELVNWF